MNITRREALKLMGKGSFALPLGVLSMGATPFSPQIQPFQQSFRIPPLLMPVRSDNDTDYYEVMMRKAQVEILPGLSTEIWGYNGITPGPIIRESRNRQSVVRFINQLPESMAILLG